MMDSLEVGNGRDRSLRMKPSNFEFQHSVNRYIKIQ